MANNKKPSYDKYKNEWLKDHFNLKLSRREKNYYESVSTGIKNQFENSEFWVNLIANLNEYNDEYKVQEGFDLFVNTDVPILDIKPYDSIILKTYRKNVIDNKNWPDKPQAGWVSPDNWYGQINDAIRTLLVVKYLDGVDFLLNKIVEHCLRFDKKCKSFYAAKEEGYYAVHLYIQDTFEIPREDWDTKEVDIKIELQISTQIQEVIRSLLRKYYEDKRKQTKKKDVVWQWDYKSEEFVANYLGHILHYVEGMIMEIKSKQKGDR